MLVLSTSMLLLGVGLTLRVDGPRAFSASWWRTLNKGHQIIDVDSEYTRRRTYSSGAGALGEDGQILFVLLSRISRRLRKQLVVYEMARKGVLTVQANQLLYGHGGR